MKELNQWTHKELMALPHRAWNNTEKLYKYLMIVSTRKKHCSGWAAIAIIGCVEEQPTEIATMCSDDIDWRLPPMKSHGYNFVIGQFRTDCAIKSGALRVWKSGAKFKVGDALSSTEITMVYENGGDK